MVPRKPDIDLISGKVCGLFNRLSLMKAGGIVGKMAAKVIRVFRKKEKAATR